MFAKLFFAEIVVQYP